MKKEEYMGALASALAGFDEELVQEIVSDYEERFRVGLENGKTEEQVIAELGSIQRKNIVFIDLDAQFADQSFTVFGFTAPVTAAADLHLPQNE